MLGNSLRSTLGWAKAELRHPERIRLFFTEDFILQPEVAMRGLANFLQVPAFSAATDRVIRQAGLLASGHFSSAVTCLASGIAQKSIMCPSALGQQPLDEMHTMMTASVEDLVIDFERQLSRASQDLRNGWEKLLEVWLQSPNTAMVSYAQTALRHDMWSPPKWWVSHNARLCRPCLFFPRGKCDNDACEYCHGPNHPKPKRTAKSKRSSRRRFDRTPSPDFRTPEWPQPSAAQLVGVPSAQLRYDRTPSPQRMWMPPSGKL